MSLPADHVAPLRTRAIAYPPAGRIAAAALVAISRGSPLLLAALLLFSEVGLGNQIRLMRWFGALCLAPGIVAWLIERNFAATLRLDAGALVLDSRTRRTEIPCALLDRIAVWALPLPANGVSLHFRSGRRFGYGLQVADPSALIEAVADAGAGERVRAAAHHPLAVYARARGEWVRHWYRPLFQFVLFALVPTLPLFRLHQWVAYGGTFGEYYSYGLKAYLLAFALYWGGLIIQLVLYAAVLRAVIEPVVLAVTAAAPSRARALRRTAEIAYRVLYYGGVPLLLVRLFL